MHVLTTLASELYVLACSEVTWLRAIHLQIALDCFYIARMGQAHKKRSTVRMKQRVATQIFAAKRISAEILARNEEN